MINYIRNRQQRIWKEHNWTPTCLTDRDFTWTIETSLHLADRDFISLGGQKLYLVDSDFISPGGQWLHFTQWAEISLHLDSDFTSLGWRRFHFTWQTNFTSLGGWRFHFTYGTVMAKACECSSASMKKRTWITKQCLCHQAMCASAHYKVITQSK